MDHQQISQLLLRWMPSGSAFSALPDAPVVSSVETVPAVVRARVSAADLLHRLGDAVAPARSEAAECRAA